MWDQGIVCYVSVSWFGNVAFKCQAKRLDPKVKYVAASRIRYVYSLPYSLTQIKRRISSFKVLLVNYTKKV